MRAWLLDHHRWRPGFDELVDAYVRLAARMNEEMTAPAQIKLADALRRVARDLGLFDEVVTAEPSGAERLLAS